MIHRWSSTPLRSFARSHVAHHFLLKHLLHCLFYLLEKDLGDPTAQSVDRVQELVLDGIEERLEHVVLKGEIMYCIIDYFKRRLLVVMINSPVAMQDGHPFLFSPFTVAPIHAVVRSVVPLAGKDKETVWVVVEDNIEEVLVSPGDVVLVLLVKRMEKILPRQTAGNQATLKQCPADPRQVHQHYARVDPRCAVERVPGEAAVPADLGHLVLRGHRCQLGPVEGPQQQPDVVHGPQEQNISVHVEQ